MQNLDFGHAPFLVIWEATRACALACLHCRADAIPSRDPKELSTAEAFALLEQVRAFSTRSPLFVITGGDPMWRKDLAAIVGHGTDLGLTMALTPSGTAACTKQRLGELKQAGLKRVAVSLDGPDPETHDAFRRVRGSYANTLKIIDAVLELELPLQINSTVSRLTLPQLGAMAERVAQFPLTLWAVFFLVQTGRGAGLEPITASECEEVLVLLDELQRRAPFGIKTTEAPHYRRVQAQRAAQSPSEGLALGRRQLRAPRAVNDGNGFVFVDHVGEIYPSGFLPVRCGNIRAGELVETYRNNDFFVRLRDPAALGGRCGRCEFKRVCGGSRARAFAATGHAFAEDPLCAYDPPARAASGDGIQGLPELPQQVAPVFDAH